MNFRQRLSSSDTAPAVRESSRAPGTYWEIEWSLSLLACCFAAAVWAGFAPLSDPDLPMHLTVGEWIYQHRSVPFVEPFAWTRVGAPYYAYSWLAQTTMYVVLRAGGPTGLHFLAGLTATAIVLAGAAAGRALKLDASRATMLGVASIFIAMESTPFLRPQFFMHALLPLAWAAGMGLCSNGSRPARAGAALTLWIVSAIAAGTHITFPIVAAPLIVLVSRESRCSRRVVMLAVLVVVAGWLASPYALSWLEVFRLNLGHNAITAERSPVGELAPGFVVAPLIGVALGSLPLFGGHRAFPATERGVIGALWLAGLVLFAWYFKGLGPWWWCALPLAAATLNELPDWSDRRTARIAAILLPLCVLAFVPTNVRLFMMARASEGDVRSRVLPSFKAAASEPAARWLESNVDIPAGAKLLTTFNYGSYLKWRLPSVSESVDSRGVFPDSAALPDVPSLEGLRHLGPWASSDIAIVPVTYPVAEILDARPEWLRIDDVLAAPSALDAPKAGLWARRAWLDAHRRAPK